MIERASVNELFEPAELLAMMPYNKEPAYLLDSCYGVSDSPPVTLTSWSAVVKKLSKEIADMPYGKKKPIG